MERENKHNWIKWLFNFLVLTALLYLIIGEVLLPSDVAAGQEMCEPYAGKWMRICENGTREQIVLPTKCNVERGETVRMETILPNEIKPGICMCFRSNRQDVEVSIDGRMRASYTTKGTRLFGSSSPAVYMFVDITPQDAGKKLMFSTVSDSIYTGVLSDVYYGNEIGIWRYFMDAYGLEFILAFILLLLGVFGVMISLILRFCYHQKVAMEYLGWALLLAGLWLTANTEIRQFFFTNISVLNEIAFIMVMLLPLPFLLFMDSVQEGRYHRLYFIMEVIGIIVFAMCVFLQCADIRDYPDTFKYMAAGCVFSILLIFGTMAADLIRHKIRDYALIAVGLGVTFLATLIQIGIYLQYSGAFHVVLLSFALIVLMILTGVSTVNDVLQMQREKQEAVLASQSKAQFLANMSHEIRTPINAVLGMDEMILRESRDKNITDYARDIESAGRSLLSLINDILDFSKIESGKMEILPVKYNLASVLNDCYHMVAMRAREKNLDLCVENDPDLPVAVFGDEVRVRQIITNLLTNGVKYTEEGSVTLTVSGQRVEDHKLNLRIVVRDTGIGISEEDQKKLFESFQRVDENRNRNVEGTGLGLTITKQLVELMGGRIWLESDYGRGSAFFVEVPQTIVKDEKMGNFAERYQESLEQMERYKESFTAPEAKILVVDDVKMNLRVFQGLLKSTKIEVDVAESGRQCIAMACKKKYHMIFLDHMMPQMDGLETLRAMLDLGDYPSREAKIIMLTANAIMGAKESYLQQGFCDYLAKPIRSGELEDMIRRYLPPELVIMEGSELTWTPEFTDGMEQLPEGGNAQDPGESENTQSAENSSGDVNDTGKSLAERFSFINTELGLSYCAEDEEFYQEILKDYIREDKTALLEESYDDEDWENYRIQVHALKSTSLSIGAEELSEGAKVLEMAAKDGRIDDIHSNHDRVLRQYRELLQKLKKSIEE